MAVCVFLLLKWKSCLVTKEQGSVHIMTLLSLCGNQSKQKRQRRTDSRTPWGVMSDGHWCIHSLFVRAVAFRSSSCWIIWAWCWCHVLFHMWNLAAADINPCIHFSASSDSFTSVVMNHFSRRPIWRCKITLTCTRSAANPKLWTFSHPYLWQSAWMSAKKNKAHLFDRPLPPHIWSHSSPFGIGEEALAKLRSWEGYFDWMP